MSMEREQLLRERAAVALLPKSHPPSTRDHTFLCVWPENCLEKVLNPYHQACSFPQENLTPEQDWASSDP